MVISAKIFQDFLEMNSQKNILKIEEKDTGTVPRISSSHCHGTPPFYRGVVPTGTLDL